MDEPSKSENRRNGKDGPPRYPGYFDGDAGGLFPLPPPEGLPVVLGPFAGFQPFAIKMCSLVMQANSACPLLLPLFWLDFGWNQKSIRLNDFLIKTTELLYSVTQPFHAS